MDRTASSIPKIALDASADLAYIRTQLQSALTARLQTHLPDALPEDAMRLAIERHITGFLQQTMTYTLKNVLINGLDPRPSDIAKGVQVDPEEFEQHDAGLHANVLKMHATLEEAMTRVATLRRQVPQEVQQAYQPTDPAAVLEACLSGSTDGQGDSVEASDQGGAVQVDIPRLAEVEETMTESCALLREIKGQVGAVHGKVQRANTALAFLSKQSGTS
ncbi:hypothetical protein BCR37DRAFT_396684 [Protomyces lactucae-debilis]|uniref:Uncharacterized protein n=1 Tax=Protomyces lactucae-debilis TaxID=2754530 RepID=A0A1Y2FSY4_PROLT|nr:uncharacterized protein BCR37DRAFT_396684 [Protomyces lactucae-debilis]ORY87088.1 hypothetical protein BCR37DRAFT_396684 [Protomyces lactucae-debilis]